MKQKNTVSHSCFSITLRMIGEGGGKVGGMVRGRREGQERASKADKASEGRRYSSTIGRIIKNIRKHRSHHHLRKRFSIGSPDSPLLLPMLSVAAAALDMREREV
jgi:hypothetical protein